MNEKEIWEKLHKNGYSRFSLYKTISKDFTTEYLSLLNKKIVALDIGCGIGNTSSFLSSYVGTVYAIDISEEVIKKAREMYKNINFVVGNGKDLSNFENDMFDFIFSYSVFIHIPREFIKSYLKDCERVLKKDGYVLFQSSSESELNKLKTPSRETHWGSEPHIGWELNDMKNFIRDELKLKLVSIKKINSSSENLNNYFILLVKE